MDGWRRHTNWESRGNGIHVGGYVVMLILAAAFSRTTHHYGLGFLLWVVLIGAWTWFYDQLVYPEIRRRHMCASREEDDAVLAAHSLDGDGGTSDEPPEDMYEED